MPRSAPALGAALAVLASVLTLAPAALAEKAPAAVPAAVTAITPTDMVMGNPKAKVTVIEYASVMCPHCAAFNAEVFPAFKAKYVDTGKVRYVFRELPTDPVNLAVAGFLVARCAPADKYFAVIDAEFRGQEELRTKRDPKAYLYNAAKAGGMTPAQVDTCINDKAGLDAFTARFKATVEAANLNSTPTFLIGGAKLEGEQSLARLDAAIEPLLAR